ncbi:MAG TPA: ABC transporter permease, partial [Pseudorhizobium sp.]|nr:ABC transporter permease [Pseudorhizobium sp.]
MSLLLRSWQGSIALFLCLAAPPGLPLVQSGTNGGAILVLLLVATGALVSFVRLSPVAAASILFVTAHLAAFLLIGTIAGNEGKANSSFFLLIVGSWLLGWRCITVLSELRPSTKTAATALRLLIPAIFGAWVLILWEAVTRGAGVPFILLPPPSAIWDRIVSSVPILAADVRQTIFKAVLFGYLVGCASGFAVA